MRIRGLVKASNNVKHQLKVGLHINEIPQFKEYIIGTIQAVENICIQAGIQPNQLPLPSRKAYKFLKEVDLKQLPIVRAKPRVQGLEPPQRSSLKRISIRQICIQHQQIQHQIAQSTISEANYDSDLVKLLEQTTARIERQCAKQGATPANLTGQSRQIYCWLKFLLRDHHLHLHIRAVHQANDLAQQTLAHKRNISKVKNRQAIDPKPINLEFTNMTSLYRGRLDTIPLIIKINEGFILADTDVMQAVMDSLLLGKTPQTSQIINEFSLSEEFSELLLTMDLTVENLEDNAQGTIHNLEDIFTRVNQAYFSNALEQPQLFWSQVCSKRKFGHYEPIHDRIVISLSLDTNKLPPYVVEFVMYHELLHKVQGCRIRNGRRQAHTTEFRQDERQFKHYEQAQEHLKHLANSL